ncbi:MaoC family dehydratase N-terminal domain-containing protein [Methylobacterium sp. J-030]|uniref:FAS1-like dehydratase domain-containing protein n=1 Tax=Methylobacterium sp. J-030 TaxID=2836627 RepID=UPI001FBAA354|nr:MaoC family dehydratase N-terminal domain-containing protein [Methylobacterium sp. J-030]MCJ2067342.1 MaoC family dehydratase N-terminal domain-containing protein [Methylobacterium sp. J-030]
MRDDLTKGSSVPAGIDHLRSWIGRSREKADRITPRILDAFQATFGQLLAPGKGDVAPPALHWCLAPETPPGDALGPDGHAAKGGFLPPVPLPRRMWAGGVVETLDILRLDDVVTRRETVRDVVLKEGRSGRLCFVTVDHVLSTARGVAIRERQDIVYRAQPGASSVAAPPQEDVPSAYAEALSIVATPTLLFRYSAMTFNGHRFHYDRPYATEVEGYADLVVHGPIQATLLMNLAARLLGHVPRQFTYRGTSALTANQTFQVCGRVGGEDCFEGVTLDQIGRVCMQADAHGAAT